MQLADQYLFLARECYFNVVPDQKFVFYVVQHFLFDVMAPGPLVVTSSGHKIVSTIEKELFAYFNKARRCPLLEIKDPKITHAFHYLFCGCQTHICFKLLSYFQFGAYHIFSFCKVLNEFIFLF